MLAIVPGLCHGQAAPGKQDAITLHSQRAQQYMAQREPLKAIPELDAVVAAEPGNVEAQANLGVLLFFQAEFAKALPHLKAAVALNGDLTKIQALAGIAERRTGNDAAGRADLEAVFPRIDEEKLKIDVGRDLIESYAAAGDLDQGAAVIAVLLKLRPTDPALLYTSYRIHADLAAEALTELGMAAPESGQTHQAMAHELQRERDLAGTIANLRKALALDASLPGIHFELAEALHASDDQRQRTEAVEQYRLAVSTAPGDVKAAYRMGDIELEQGHLAAAAGFYKRALALQPNNAEAGIGLANVLAEQGDAAAAVKLLEKVEAEEPANYLAHFRLSALYRKLNRPEDVKRELALYQQYKQEHDRLKAVYQQMRLASASDESER